MYTPDSDSVYCMYLCWNLQWQHVVKEQFPDAKMLPILRPLEVSRTIRSKWCNIEINQLYDHHMASHHAFWTALRFNKTISLVNLFLFYHAKLQFCLFFSLFLEIWGLLHSIVSSWIDYKFLVRQSVILQLPAASSIDSFSCSFKYFYLISLTQYILRFFKF